jgi:hypothetical protein
MTANLKIKSIESSTMYSGFTNTVVKNSAITGADEAQSSATAVNGPDKDVIYLFHIERQIKENISLVKLFQKVQKQYVSNRSIE